jgi:hypothetical protein
MEAKLKHLEFIQAVISRMAQNSFLFKGWAITIAAGLSAFGAVHAKHSLLAMAVVSTVVFWGLDGYYLWLERAFINLYAVVAQKQETEIDFAMRPDKKCAAWNWFKTCSRPHLLSFYGVLIAVDAIGVFLVNGDKCG